MSNQLIIHRLAIDYSLMSLMSLMSWISYVWRQFPQCSLFSRLAASAVIRNPQSSTLIPCGSSQFYGFINCLALRDAILGDAG